MAVAPNAPRKTILVVEDSAPILSLVREILETADFIVLAAANTGEAIQLAKHAKVIHLLLSDVMMPDMSGPALATKLKDSWQDMRVILMSGYAGGEMLVLNHGWHFIQKPFFPVQLVAKINEALYSDVRDQGTDHFDTRM
jgi:two-component system, cell cycle sensor histidine kinase and response regulator CckA